MRWLWIDRIIELVPRQRLVAVKSVSHAEGPLADHFPAGATTFAAPGEGRADRPPRPAMPLMPASLIIEGMAQAAGILVADAEEYREKVILAKITLAELDRDAPPGTTLRYTAVMQRIDRQGASTSGTVELLDHAAAPRGYQPLGRIDLMFSHIDRNMAGLEFPEENFVFGESFKTLLRQSGIKT